MSTKLKTKQSAVTSGCACKEQCSGTSQFLDAYVMMIIAFITIKSGSVPLIEGLCA